MPENVYTNGRMRFDDTKEEEDFNKLYEDLMYNISLRKTENMAYNKNNNYSIITHIKALDQSNISF